MQHLCNKGMRLALALPSRHSTARRTKRTKHNCASRAREEKTWRRKNIAAERKNLLRRSISATPARKLIMA